MSTTTTFDNLPHSLRDRYWTTRENIVQIRHLIGGGFAIDLGEGIVHEWRWNAARKCWQTTCGKSYRTAAV